MHSARTCPNYRHDITNVTLINKTPSSRRHAHATTLRRSLLHDDKSVHGQLESFELIMESNEHLQVYRDNLFLSDLAFLTNNLSYNRRHLLQTINIITQNLLHLAHSKEFLLSWSKPLPYFSCHDRNISGSMLLQSKSKYERALHLRPSKCCTYKISFSK